LRGQNRAMNPCLKSFGKNLSAKDDHMPRLGPKETRPKR
jgi:hypothetical protein